MQVTQAESSTSPHFEKPVFNQDPDNSEAAYEPLKEIHPFEGESDDEIVDIQLRKPRLRHEVGGVKKVADALRKISRPEQEIVLHPQPR